MFPGGDIGVVVALGKVGVLKKLPFMNFITSIYLMFLAFQIEVRYNLKEDDTMDIEKIKEAVMKKDFYKRLFVILLGVFFLALTYNLFLKPYNLVIGGTTGLSIVVEPVFGWDPTIFLYVCTAILLVLSLVLLGRKRTGISIIGSVMYPVFITLTEPIANFLIPYLQFDNMLLVVLASGLLYGLGYGLVYKMGFDTGGSDIVVRILNKYLHMPEGRCAFLIQSVVIIIGGFVFGVTQLIYAIIILIIYTNLMDKILIGISNSKLFFVHTKELEKVKDFIINELHTGVSILEMEGGYSKKKSSILMCVVRNNDYYLFKEAILGVDKEAFFVINDCYEVHGGVKRQNLPFM